MGKIRRTKEKPVEEHLKDSCEARGGFAIKLNPLWNIGIQDRLAVWVDDDGRVHIAFVETKRPVGGVLSGAQKWWNKRLTGLGLAAYVANTKAIVDALMRDGAL